MSMKSVSPARLLSAVCCAVLGAFVAQTWQPSMQQLSLAPVLSKLSSWTAPAYTCQRPAYVLRMISYDPFVAHLENFITPVEAEHLKSLAEPKLFKSRVVNQERQRVLSPDRTSSTAFFPKDDPVVGCLRQRASEVQGHLHTRDIDMQATVYKPGEFFRAHHDIGGMERLNWTDSLYRISTIFGILSADCVHCGTRFPYLELDRLALEDGICDFVECDQDVLTIKAKSGSAVFWRNRRQDGSEDHRMLHEGLPVVNGSKYGLNIWSHETTEEARLPEEYRIRYET